MSTIEDIREGFASLKIGGFRAISSLPKGYEAYIINTSDGYGVAIEIDGKMEVSEKFNSCRLYTSMLGIDGEYRNFLILCSLYKEFRYEFASICAEFVEPGDGGKNRMELLNDPFSWWIKWKELIGNTSREKKVYNVIAEMLVLAQKRSEDSSAEWTATKSGSHDIECSTESCEVKSTIKRYGATVTISGQHQLEYVKKMWLYFCRMEESKEGVSINDMKSILVANGYNEGKLEDEIVRQGFEKGSSIRNKKYKLLEKRKYKVDNSFPRIVKESFSEGKFPDSIIHIEYTVDLDSIEYTAW